MTTRFDNQTSWATSHGCCCNACLCRRAGIRLIPFHSPFGDEVYGISFNRPPSHDNPTSIGDSIDTLMISDNALPMWDAEFQSVARRVANMLGINVDRVNLTHFRQYITNFITIHEPDEDAPEHEKEAFRRMRVILDNMLGRLGDVTGNRGQLWFYFNDRTSHLWRNWVCYDDMYTSRFDRTDVLHKYTRLTELQHSDPNIAQGLVAYQRQGITRHPIDDFGPCWLYSTNVNPYEGNTCFFSPYRFLDIHMPEVPSLRVRGHITTRVREQDQRPNDTGGGGGGFPLTNNQGGSGGGNGGQPPPPPPEGMYVMEHEPITFHLPPQLHNIIIGDPYNFVFTPKYIEFWWRRVDLVCVRPFGSWADDADYGDYDRPWSNVSWVHDSRGNRWVSCDGSKTITNADGESETIQDPNCRSYVESFYVADSISAGVRANLNAVAQLNGEDVYFNCQNRWANVVISDYPIGPEKRRWTSANMDENGVITIDDDRWACGDRSHIKRYQLGDDIWVSSGRPGNPRLGIQPVRDTATKLLTDAHAYKYKYEVFTHGLLVRKAIEAYPPLPHYPDEVEKRNFVLELQERLEIMAKRRVEIATTLARIGLRLDVVEAHIAAQVRVLNVQLRGLREDLDEAPDPNEPGIDEEEREIRRHRIEQLEERIKEVEEEIRTIRASTPEIRALRDWRDELVEEDCMIHLPCIDRRMAVLRVDQEEARRVLRNLRANRTKFRELLEKCFGENPSDDEECEDLDKQEVIDYLALLNQQIPVLASKLVDINSELRRLRRERWKFMTEDERAADEAAELEDDLRELRAEYAWWVALVGDTSDLMIDQEQSDSGPGGNVAGSTFTHDDPEMPHMIRFGRMRNDHCITMMYRWEIDTTIRKIEKVWRDLRLSKKAKVADPYIWRFDTYLWNNVIQEGMAYYRLPFEDTIGIHRIQENDRIINLNPQQSALTEMILSRVTSPTELLVGVSMMQAWFASPTIMTIRGAIRETQFLRKRGLGQRTNWDFAWARELTGDGVQTGRHSIQTSRRTIGGMQCLLHYVETNRSDAIESHVDRLRQDINELNRELFFAEPGSPERSDLQRRVNQLFQEMDDARAFPDDWRYKRPGISWDERLIPLADCRPYGLVGKTILNTSGWSAPITPIITTHDPSSISDWRKANDPQIKDFYEVSFCPDTGVTLYTLKEGSDLIANIIVPSQIRGYTIVKDDKFKWQMRSFKEVMVDGRREFEEVWVDDPEFADVNEFLVWFDGTSFIQKPYQPDTRYGGLLYKMNSHRFSPTLSLSSPLNAINTNVEEFTIHNTQFLNRRHALASIDCHDGLLTITFFDHNYPINNPAPRGQVPFWYGDITFAPDTFIASGRRVEHRKYFIALKGGSGWLCTFEHFNPLLPEIHNFRNFWWQNGFYFIQNDYATFRIVQVQDGITLMPLRNAQLVPELSVDISNPSQPDVPWKNQIRATVFTSHAKIIGKSNTSGSTWFIDRILPNELDTKEVFPVSREAEFNERVIALEQEFSEIYEIYEREWINSLTGVGSTQLASLRAQLDALLVQINKLRQDEISPVIFFNMLRPSLRREQGEVSARVSELEARIKELKDDFRFSAARILEREVERLIDSVTGHNQYDICMMIQELPASRRSFELRNGIHYIVICPRDQIKRVQVVDGWAFILTGNGELYRGRLPNQDQQLRSFGLRLCLPVDPNPNVSLDRAPILDFWMDTPSKGRAIYRDMYTRGYTLALTLHSSDWFTDRYHAIKQRLDLAIEDEPYGGTSCAAQILDSHYDNPDLIVNYKGWLWRYANHEWIHTGVVAKEYRTASFSEGQEIAPPYCSEDPDDDDATPCPDDEECVDGECVPICPNTEDGTRQRWDGEQCVPFREGRLTNEERKDLHQSLTAPPVPPTIGGATTWDRPGCGASVNNEFVIDPRGFPGPPFMTYDSLIGGGDIRTEDIIGAVNMSDLNAIIHIIQSAASYGELAAINDHIYLGQKYARILQGLLRGLAATDQHLQWEYIDSIREILLIELVYNKYFYVKATTSLWQYNGNTWMEFLIIEGQGMPTIDERDYIDMHCFIDETRDYDEVTGELIGCRRAMEKENLEKAIEAFNADTFIPSRIAELNVLLKAGFDFDGGNVRSIMTEATAIIDNPENGLHPVDEDGESDEEIIRQVRDILLQMANHLMQGSLHFRKVRYLLDFTFALIRDQMIPLYGDNIRFHELMGEIDKHRLRVSISVEQAWEFYERAYEIAESLVSDVMYSFRDNDFRKPPETEDEDEGEDCEPCDCDCKFPSETMGIEDIYHRGRPPDRPYMLDIYKPSGLISFTPSVNQEFVIHLEQWTTDKGQNWSRWDNCLGWCGAFPVNLEDRISDLPDIIIGNQSDDLWDSAYDWWVFEYEITGFSPPNSGWIWTEEMHWFYRFWRLTNIQSNIEIDEDNENEFYRNNKELYKVEGISYLRTLTGSLAREVRASRSAGQVQDFRRFYLLLDPPPSMLRDNTVKRLTIGTRITWLQNQIAINGATDEWTYELAGLSAFFAELPLRALYHEEYLFDITIFD